MANIQSDNDLENVVGGVGRNASGKSNGNGVPVCPSCGSNTHVILNLHGDYWCTKCDCSVQIN